MLFDFLDLYFESLGKVFLFYLDILASKWVERSNASGYLVLLKYKVHTIFSQTHNKDISKSSKDNVGDKPQGRSIDQQIDIEMEIACKVSKVYPASCPQTTFLDAVSLHS